MYGQYHDGFLFVPNTQRSSNVERVFRRALLITLISNDVTGVTEMSAYIDASKQW